MKFGKGSGMCKKCHVTECGNDYEKCLYLQAHCFWCNEPIYAQSVYQVNCFYNQSWDGTPICDWCSEGLKTNGKPHEDILRKKLGLDPIKKKKEIITMEKWI